ncbi:MAG TPA: alpha/beta hydrolase [Steroidobacteraceae bacterium]|nr:alpha/beta hydrolase [Steroidobacteraceae bacterium]
MTSIKNADVTLPVSVVGEGQTLIFFNGLGSTQATWKRVIAQLKRRYRVVTFDFRGHGRATSANDYSFKAFLSDAAAVINGLGLGRPIIVGWSLGADLAVWYAAAHPGTVAGIVVVDGAVPIPGRLIRDPAKTRRLLNSPLMKAALFVWRLTPYGYRLSGDEIADVTLGVDERRQQLSEVYDKVDCPVTMVLAQKSAKPGPDAERMNNLWRAGAERLAGKYPALPIAWLNSTHLLPFRKPVELAKVIDGLCAALP